MSVQIANVNPAIQSFQNWIDKTNEALYVISTQAMTASLTTEGSNTSGNSTLLGSFAANTIAVANTLRGGSVTTPANLTITTNTVISNTGQFFVNNTSIRVLNTNTYIESSKTTLAGGSANVESNVSITGAVTSIASANVGLTSDVLVFRTQANTMLVNGSNTTLTSNITISGTNTNISSNVFFTGTVNFDGGLSVVGTSELKGDVKLGNTAANTISVVGAVNTHILPDQDLRRNLGSADKRWDELHVGTINVVAVEYNGSLIGVETVGSRTLTVGNTTHYMSYSNGNIGSANTAGVFTPVPVLSVDASEGRTIKAIIQMRNDNINTYSSSELLIVHDETTPSMTVYATLSTNTSAPAYEYTADISGGFVRVLAKQPAGSGNSAVTALVQYIKA